MGSFKIGFTSTTFRQIKSIQKIVEIAKEANVGYIEWGGDIHVKTVEDAQKAKKLCDEAGIKISSYGSYYVVGSGDKAQWERICEIAGAMSADSVRVWLGKKNSEKTDANEYNRLLNDAREICDVAASYSLKVCPECHDNTYNNNTDAVLRFQKELQRDNFKTYFQSRYFKKAYDIDRIERTFPIIENVHISYSELMREQFFRKRDKEYINALLNKLKYMNFDGIVMLEYTYFASKKYFISDINKLRKF